MPRTLSTLLFALCLGAVGLGCHSSSSQKYSSPYKDQPLPPPSPPSWESPEKTIYTPPIQANAKLAPRMEVAWYIFADAQQQVPVMAGQSQIGPDGTVVIAAYGQYTIAGLTVAQASQVIEKGVRKWDPKTPNSRVQLQLVGASALGNQNWNPPSAKIEPTTWSSASIAAPTNIKPVTFSEADWSTPINSVPRPNYFGSVWQQSAAPTPTPTNGPATTTSSTRRNVRSPIMTHFFGPRYQ